MRKTLAALVLVIFTVLALQLPARAGTPDPPETPAGCFFFDLTTFGAHPFYTVTDQLSVLFVTTEIGTTRYDFPVPGTTYQGPVFYLVKCVDFFDETTVVTPTPTPVEPTPTVPTSTPTPTLEPTPTITPTPTFVQEQTPTPDPTPDTSEDTETGTLEELPNTGSNAPTDIYLLGVVIILLGCQLVFFSRWFTRS